MNPKDNLTFYHELLNCNYPLSRWEYDKDFRLIYTDYTENLFTDGFLTPPAAGSPGRTGKTG